MRRIGLALALCAVLALALGVTSATAHAAIQAGKSSLKPRPAKPLKTPRWPTTVGR